MTGTAYVLFPTWTDYNGQDDLIWHSGNVTGSQGSYTVNISNHNAERGLYITNIYAYDKYGNCLSYIGAYVNM